MQKLTSKLKPPGFVIEIGLHPLVSETASQCFGMPSSAERLSSKLTGINHYELSLPWATHGFDWTLNGPGGQLSTFAVMQFLQGVVQSKLVVFRRCEYLRYAVLLSILPTLATTRGLKIRCFC